MQELQSLCLEMSNIQQASRDFYGFFSHHLAAADRKQQQQQEAAEVFLIVSYGMYFQIVFLIRLVPYSLKAVIKNKKFKSALKIDGLTPAPRHLSRVTRKFLTCRVKTGLHQ